MATATFRFYGPLNDFLPFFLRRRELLHVFSPPATVKDRVESMGVPHPEVGGIVANGEAVDFAHRVQDGDRVAVYPAFLNFGAPCALRPAPPDRFVLDQHLARLAAYLRLLGLDTLHRPVFPDAELAHVSAEEDRILLTRDRGLLMRKEVVHGAFLRATDPKAQVREVLRRFPVAESIAPFSRCMRCNGLLQEISKQAVAERLLPTTLVLYDRFQFCPTCDRVYWDGPHVRRMRGWVQAWMQGSGPQAGP